MRSAILALALAFIGTGVAFPGEIKVESFFPCKYEEFVSSDLAESFHYHEGEVVKVENGYSYVGTYENGKPFTILLKNMCPKKPCLKEGDYVRLFIDPKTGRACVVHK